LSFTIIGDAVNTANRLQSVPRQLGAPLVASDTVVQAIKAGAGVESKAVAAPPNLRDRGKYELRGRRAPVHIWTWDTDA